jgi:hypothetical protein
MKKIETLYIPNCSCADYAVCSLPVHIVSGLCDPVECCLSACL